MSPPENYDTWFNYWGETDDDQRVSVSVPHIPPFSQQIGLRNICYVIQEKWMLSVILISVSAVINATYFGVGDR